MEIRTTREPDAGSGSDAAKPAMAGAGPRVIDERESWTIFHSKTKRVFGVFYSKAEYMAAARVAPRPARVVVRYPREHLM